MHILNSCVVKQDSILKTGMYVRQPSRTLSLPVLFLVALNVLTTITANHLPLYQCVAIASESSFFL